MPRRSRRRMVGKWEQIEQEAREDELTELERELDGKQQRGRKQKPRHRRRRKRPGPDAPYEGTARDNGTDLRGKPKHPYQSPNDAQDKQ